jgi:hypothetical protein
MKQFLLISTFLATMSCISIAQTMDHRKMKHGTGSVMEMNTGVPTEPGQSAFAAIQEIVVLLEAGPTTDWSKVNLEPLCHRRQH